MTTFNRALSKSYSGTGEDTDNILIKGRGTLQLSGTFSASIQLMRSNPDESNFVPVLLGDATAATITVAGAISIIEASEGGGLYHTKCTVYASGTCDTRITNVADPE